MALFFFIALIKVAFPSDFSSTYTMGFVPVKFGHSNPSIWKFDPRRTLQLSPPPLAIHFTETR